LSPTPFIFVTVLFSVFVGYLFDAVYVRGLIRLTRALGRRVYFPL